MCVCVCLCVYVWVKVPVYSHRSEVKFTDCSSQTAQQQLPSFALEFEKIPGFKGGKTKQYLAAKFRLICWPARFFFFFNATTSQETVKQKNNRKKKGCYWEWLFSQPSVAASSQPVEMLLLNLPGCSLYILYSLHFGRTFPKRKQNTSCSLWKLLRSLCVFLLVLKCKTFWFPKPKARLFNSKAVD